MAKKLVCGQFVLIVFIMLCCTIFLGCNSGNVYCKFLNEDDIVLILNTPNSTAKAEIISNTAFSASWDESIIDYNTQTGVITSKLQGTTKLTITYYKNSKKQTKSINIKVVNPAFASSIILQDSYIILKDSGKNLLHPNIITQNNQKYNLDLYYEVSDRRVAIVDGKNIIPQGVGECDLKVKAICGYNEQTNQYEFVENTTKLIVQPGIKSANIFVCDKNKTKLSLNEQNQYELFYGGVSLEYYLMIEADQSLRHYNFAIENKNFFQIGEPVEYQNDNLAFIPISFKNFGETNLKLIFKDTENNFILQSNSLSVVVYKIISEQDIQIKATKEFCDDEQSFNKKFANLSFVDGKYQLYKINDACLDFKRQAITDKKYFYGLICFDNLDTNCYNDIETEVVNLKVNKNFGEYIRFETIDDGFASLELTLTAKDGSSFTKLFTFDVTKVLAEDFEVAGAQKMFLTKDDYFDFCPKNISPIYGLYDFELSVTSGNAVALNGTIAQAVNVGKSELALTLNGSVYCCEIQVVDENCSLNLEMNKTKIAEIFKIQITIEVKNSANNQIEILPENIEVLESDFDYVTKSTNSVIIENRQIIEQISLKITLGNIVLTKTANIVWEA